jgi:hypothetical protein
MTSTLAFRHLEASPTSTGVASAMSPLDLISQISIYLIEQEIGKLVNRYHLNRRTPLTEGNLGQWPGCIRCVIGNLFASIGPILLMLDCLDAAFFWDPLQNERWERGLKRLLANRRRVEVILPLRSASISAASGWHEERDFETFKSTAAWPQFQKYNREMRGNPSFMEFQLFLCSHAYEKEKEFQGLGAVIRHGKRNFAPRFLWIASDVVMFAPPGLEPRTPVVVTSSVEPQEIRRYTDIWERESKDAGG